MPWEIEITGDKSDLEELSKVFIGKNLSIAQENEHFILKSEEFEALFDHDEVETKAIELLRSVDACAKITLGSRKVIEHESISWLNENGSRKMFIKVKAFVGLVSCEANYKITHSDGTIETYNQAIAAVNWMKLAQRDNMVRKVLDQIHNDFNSWDSFYKIYEMLRDDKFEKITDKGSIYYKKADLLRRTANHYRHSNYALPPNPMPLSEAKAFINIVLHDWLKDKENKLLKVN